MAISLLPLTASSRLRSPMVISLLPLTVSSRPRNRKERKFPKTRKTVKQQIRLSRTLQLRKTSSAGCGDISDRDSALRKLPDRTDPRQGG
jgi:hypothetical protein